MKRKKRRVRKDGRVHLGFRVTPDLKRMVETAAAQVGRSQSQEAEIRLERSFATEGLLSDVLELAYGRDLAGILMMIGDAARLTGSAAATFENNVDWFRSAYAYDQASKAAQRVLEAQRPRGEVRHPAVPQAEHLGVAIANSVLEEAATGTSRLVPGGAERAERLHKLVGTGTAHLTLVDLDPMALSYRDEASGTVVMVTMTNRSPGEESA